MANKENENVVEQCARRDRDDNFNKESDVSSIEAEGNLDPGDFCVQKVFYYII